MKNIKSPFQESPDKKKKKKKEEEEEEEEEEGMRKPYNKQQ